MNRVLWRHSWNLSSDLIYFASPDQLAGMIVDDPAPVETLVGDRRLIESLLTSLNGLAARLDDAVDYQAMQDLRGKLARFYSGHVEPFRIEYVVDEFGVTPRPSSVYEQSIFVDTLEALRVGSKIAINFHGFGGTHPRWVFRTSEGKVTSMVGESVSLSVAPRAASEALIIKAYLVDESTGRPVQQVTYRYSVL